MLSLSQTTGYAIKALTALAEGPDARAQTGDIAQSADVPKPYLSKIIQSLARAGVVVPKRGIGGGVSLARAAEKISLLEIVEAVEGEAWLGDCLLGFDECTSTANCPTHAFWQRVRREIVQELRQTSLASVIEFRIQSRAAARGGRKPGTRGSAPRSGARGKRSLRPTRAGSSASQQPQPKRAP